jgi:hypothetical protein
MNALKVELPPDLHKQVKALAALRGVTIRQVVESLLRQWVKKQENHG